MTAGLQSDPHMQGFNTSHKVRMLECCAATFCVVTQATMQHSEPQIQDLLYLRQLFYGKLGQLARQRSALLSHMTCYKIDESHVSDKVTQLTHWSEQLRENAAEEHQSYKQFSSAFYRGVRLSFFLVSLACYCPQTLSCSK